MKNIRAIIYFSLLLIIVDASTHNSNKRVLNIEKLLIWDINTLDSIRSHTESKMYLLENAEKEILMADVVVTNKKQSLTGDKHNYESLSSYYWPDPNNKVGPYMNIDGMVNPETLDYDREKIDRLADRCKILSTAYYISGNERYYKALVRQLEAWFVSESTRMNPHMQYSQVIKGKYNNQGQAHGIIDAYAFTNVLESIRLIELKTTLPTELSNGLHKWFSCFVNWLLNSEQGKIESRQPNNHCPLYYALLTNIAIYIGEEKLIYDILNKYPQEVVERLIMEDGSQPGELIRTRAYHYSILSLSAIIDYCCIIETYAPEFYMSNRCRIDKGIEYLQKYRDKKEEFPAQEIGNWDFEVALLDMEIKRLEKLRTKINS